MKLIYRILFLAVFLGLVPLSCERCNSSECECETPPRYSGFEITDMGIRTIVSQSHTDADTSMYYSYNKVAIAVSITDQRNIVEKVKSNFSFQSTAFACSPIGPHSNQHIQNVEITAAKEVVYESPQDTIKAGDKISNRFSFDLHFTSPSDSLTEFLKDEPALTGYGSFYFRLNSAPYQPTTLVIDVEVTLSDGQVFKFEDEVLKVK